VNSQTFQTSSEEEMIALGEHIASLLPRRAVVFLCGDLGAGKTTLTKGIAKGLGAADPDEVSSPTFTLIHEYGSPARVYHIDLYRIETERQLASLGLDELFDREAVVVIEWPEKFARWLPGEAVVIRIASAGDGRTITLQM
jgi:tRNA threonylcarbamoyladenosine biosynthesis protein TsaE